MILWAIFNLVLALLILLGVSSGAAVILAWSIIIGWIVAVIVGIAKAS